MFLASGSVLIFDGFLKVLAVSTEEKEGFLPELNLAEHLELVNLIPSQHFTRPPARYSEASLVKALEEKGIGRPSTYAPIIYTLLIRNYIRREKGYIVCTELGIKVNDILVEYFPNIIDVGFTASMEEELDKVEEGTLNWVAVLRDFYLPFKDKLSYAQENLKKEIIYTKQICELCGQPMVIKWSKMGKFLSCSAFPKCRNAKSISSGVKCPAADCGGELVMRRSKRGLRFYGCSNYPKCRYVTKFLPKSDDKQTTQQKSSTDSEKS